ncbi:hypothetical protein M0638_17465 [Roseomonas sp. NAR14]|uniref:Lipoprotein n=1 Tax=Roseomonas acroporae TaxID=2937791 RepID=A0A9X1YCG8_9PROT|nr:hypothetical protein [Roseomonas acroporae]MCK8786167.1 hypothetical protein [Roseomonas acroporae]
MRDPTWLAIPGRAILALLALLPAGCVSPAQQAAMDRGRCAGFGFAEGSDAFAGCMMNLSQQRDAEEAADDRAFMQRQAIENQARQDRANRR